MLRSLNILASVLSYSSILAESLAILIFCYKPNRAVSLLTKLVSPSEPNRLLLAIFVNVVRLPLRLSISVPFSVVFLMLASV